MGGVFLKQDLKYLEKKADILKAIAHPVRLCIVNGLINNKKNVSQMQECLSIPQSTVSRHLSKLKSLGIVSCERDKLEMYYTVTNKEITEVVNVLLKTEGKDNL